MLNYQQLATDYRNHGGRAVCRELTEGLDKGHLKPSDFSVRELAESLVENGREWVRSMDPRNGVSILESMDAVDSTAFSNITGQLVINELMAAYESPAFAISQLFKTVSTRLNGEVIPGIGKIGDQAEVIHEGMPYPHVGVGEDYVTTPQTDKHGLIVPVTKETVFFDRTGIILDRAREVGESLGLRKEKRCVDLLIGVTNNHKWKGTSYDTYQAAAPWINLLAGAAYDLVDWSDVDAAEQLFAEITDPNTGEPVNVMATQILATPAKRHHVNRILNATEVRYTASGAATETLAANPITGYGSAISKFLYSRLKASGLSAAQAQATWFLGDIAKAFHYMENWPITVVQAPQNSEAEFNQDIVARFKASERGAPFAANPRFVVKVNGYE